MLFFICDKVFWKHTPNSSVNAITWEIMLFLALDLFRKIHEITPIPIKIPYSYLRWYWGESSDDGAVQLWQYLQDLRKELLGYNFAGWCLSATLAKRSDGTGIAKENKKVL